jgi:menaquinone-dependent protoporphyrinogen oxidase
VTRFLVVYVTHDGQTGRIARRITRQIVRGLADHPARRADGPAGGRPGVQSFRLGRDTPPAPAGFDAVIAGGCVRYGRHDRVLVDYLRRHAASLASKTTGIFSVDLVSRDPSKSDAGGNVYLRKLLDRIGFAPDLATAFAGRLDYPRYRWFDRWMIRAIMRALGGPTDPRAVVEYTDFAAVDRFSREMLKLSHQSDRADAHGETGC